MLTLFRNGLINLELVHTVTDHHNHKIPYSLHKKVEGVAKLKTWCALQFACGSLTLMILMLMQYTFESGWVPAIMALTIISGFMYVFQEHVDIPPAIQTLMRLHRDGFYGFYKLHWEFPRMQHEAVRILETTIVRLKASENMHGLEHPQTKKIRTQLRKAHEIFVTCSLVEAKLGHFFDTVQRGTLASKIERAEEATDQQ